MIDWVQVKHASAPIQRESLLLLDDGSVIIGCYKLGMAVVAWSVLNRPAFIKQGGRFKPGEQHPKVTLSDADCELIRELCDPDSPVRLTYRQAAVKFECSPSTIASIVNYRTRAHGSYDHA